MHSGLFKLAALLLFGTVVFAEAAERDSQPVILVVGDSLSAGYGIELNDTWTSLLQTRLNEKGYGYRVVNASISGDTTANGARRMPRALDLHQPDIVIIALGGNDGLRGLAVAEMRSNLARMITLAQDAGARVVLAGILIPPNYGDEYAGEFADVYPELANEYQVTLIPFFMEGVALDPSKMQEDGIHPNEDAQPILLETVWTVLASELESLQESAGTTGRRNDSAASNPVALPAS